MLAGCWRDEVKNRDKGFLQRKAEWQIFEVKAKKKGLNVMKYFNLS